MFNLHRLFVLFHWQFHSIHHCCIYTFFICVRIPSFLILPLLQPYFPVSLLSHKTPASIQYMSSLISGFLPSMNPSFPSSHCQCSNPTVCTVFKSTCPASLSFSPNLLSWIPTLKHPSYSASLRSWIHSERCPHPTGPASMLSSSHLSYINVVLIPPVLHLCCPHPTCPASMLACIPLPYVLLSWIHHVPLFSWTKAECSQPKILPKFAQKVVRNKNLQKSLFCNLQLHTK